MTNRCKSRICRQVRCTLTRPISHYADVLAQFNARLSQHQADHVAVPRYGLKLLERATKVRAEAVPKASAARREHLQPTARVSTPLLRVDFLLTESVILQNALYKECANLMGCLKKM